MASRIVQPCGCASCGEIEYHCDQHKPAKGGESFLLRQNLRGMASATAERAAEHIEWLRSVLAIVRERERNPRSAGLAHAEIVDMEAYARYLAALDAATS